MPCYNFKKYIENQQNNYLDGKLTGLTHESLRKMAKSKFDWLVNKKKWGARSPDDDKIIAMAAEINTLKGQLKLAPKLAELANDKNKGLELTITHQDAWPTLLTFSPTSSSSHKASRSRE